MIAFSAAGLSIQNFGYIQKNTFYEYMLYFLMSCQIFLFLFISLQKLADTVYSLYIENIFVC